jgi:hypothetical protein
MGDGYYIIVGLKIRALSTKSFCFVDCNVIFWRTIDGYSMACDEVKCIL